MNILQYCINGISIGSIYAIIALGYTMVYGIAKMLNFAHGDIIMVGAYICYCVTNYLGMPPILGILASMAVCTLLGIVIEGLAYKPLRGTPSLAVLITAIGVSYFLQNAAQLIWGSNPKSFTSVVSTIKPFLLFGSLTITGEVLVTVVVSVVIMLALTWFTSSTRIGKSMRAVSEDRDAAQLMGINVNKTISITFAIGSALAAVAGVLMCSSIPVLQPTTGSMPGLRAFTAAVLGGMGNILGSVISATVLYILPEAMRGLNDYRMIIYAVVLILVMLFTWSPKVSEWNSVLVDKVKHMFVKQTKEAEVK